MNHFWTNVVNILKVGAPVVAQAIGGPAGNVSAALLTAVLAKVDEVNGKLPGTTTPCALDANPEFHAELIKAEQAINNLFSMAQSIVSGNKQ